MLDKNLYGGYYGFISGLLVLHAFSPVGFVSRLVPISIELFTVLAVLGAGVLFRIALPTTIVQTHIRRIVLPGVILAVITARIIEELTYSNFVFTHTHFDPNALILLSFFVCATALVTIQKRDVSKNATYLIALLSVLLLHIPLMAWYNYPFYNSLSGEDKVFEWIQFGLFQGGAIILGLLSYRVWGYRQTTIAQFLFVYSVIGALGYFLIAGEEISWGQRIFDFDTPKEYIDYNSQGEFNLHNNEKIFNKIYLVYGSVGLYTLISALIYEAFKKSVKGFKARALSLFAFRWYHGLYFIPTIIYVAYRVYYQTSAYDIWEESTEVLFAAGMLAYAVQVWQVAHSIVAKESRSSHSSVQP